MIRTEGVIRSVILGIILFGWISDGRPQDRPLTSERVNRAIIAFGEAVEAGAEGDLNRAAVQISNAIRLDPTRIEIIYLAGIVGAYQKGGIGKTCATDVFSGFLKLYTTPPENRKPETTQKIMVDGSCTGKSLSSARLLAISGSLREAGYVYDAILALEPENLLARFWKAELLRSISSTSEALTELQKCAMRVPENYQVYGMMASIFLDNKNYSESVRYFEKAIASYPDYAISLQPNVEICAAYNGRGKESLERNDLMAALSDFSAAIHLNPVFGEFYLNRGITYRRMGNVEEAIDDFSRAVIYDSRYQDAYYNRGLLFEQIGYYAQALRDFNRVVRMKRSHAGARYQMGLIHIKQRDYVEAVAAFDSLLIYHPDHYLAVYSKACAQDELHHYRLAAAAYEKFFDMAPDSLYEQKLKAWERARTIRNVLHEKYGE
jgi:tetratricopeptide (TPR) repeat protein